MKRYQRNCLMYITMTVLTLVIWALLSGCHPQFHLFGTYPSKECTPCEQADELERDPRWDALEDDDV